MILVRDIYRYIDELAPFSAQAGYDNSGLVIGNPYYGVKTMLTALDITNDIIADAEELGAELIVTHHPPIFRAIKRIDTESPVGNLAMNGISVISAHTSFDSAKGGMNDILCERLGLTPDRPLAIEDGVPIGYICQCAATTPEEFADKIKAALNCEVVRYNDMGGSIETVAVCSGSGGSLLADVLANECDAYITGDIKHDVFIDAYNAGLTVFDAGHFHTEDLFTDFMAQKLSEKFPELTVLKAPSDRDVLSYA
ncbi:Nif3-like dinuclear metal center hexameric protein [Ruminococcus sp. NK3A76]|uniref:Nif3-like dinuclear metal center hexameric protein n=1 Tax=Ruminococcus sp. NK3A76 TaxID=877411 RepID=UPI0004914BD1|nr:Nif3-like dinuclear metal center hexameric protein [Ruminococcus sp. NK3A76]